MALLPGEIFVPESAAAIREATLKDLRLEAIKFGIADPPVTPGTANYIFATGVSNQLMLFYSSLSIRDAQRNIFTAIEEDLDELRKSYGLAEVPATPGSGNIIIKVNGTATIPDGLEFTFPNGKRGKVVGLQLGIVNNSSIPVVGIDKGDNTNLISGILKFRNPPLNVAVEATVDPAKPISGGFDAEDDERKRTRILNKLQNPPGGGNWSQFVATALDATPAVQQAFVYPALGGPGSVKVVVVSSYNSVFSRVPSDQVISDVETALRITYPSENQIEVTYPTDVPVNVTILASLPNAVNSDQGWTNINVWPPLEDDDPGFIEVLDAPSTTTITVSAETATPPEDNVTEIMWWNDTTKTFLKSIVTAHAGGAGGWDLTLETPLDDGTTVVAIGDFISPSAANADNYVQSWIAALNSLGPGENTDDPHRIDRSYRHISSSEDWPTNISAIQLSQLSIDSSEFSSINYGSLSQSSPEVPASVGDPPEILTIGKFAIYKAV